MPPGWLLIGEHAEVLYGNARGVGPSDRQFHAGGYGLTILCGGSQLSVEHRFQSGLIQFRESRGLTNNRAGGIRRLMSCLCADLAPIIWGDVHTFAYLGGKV
jgi:hypothetical protein